MKVASIVLISIGAFINFAIGSNQRVMTWTEDASVYSTDPNTGFATVTPKFIEHSFTPWTWTWGIGLMAVGIVLLVIWLVRHKKKRVI